METPELRICKSCNSELTARDVDFCEACRRDIYEGEPEPEVDWDDDEDDEEE